jgi:nucleotide-binding universal stress UspA family protein
MIKITNVLVATDFSPASESALTYGREFARAFGARLHVLHIVDSSLMFIGPEAVGVDVMRLQADLEAGAQNTLARIVTAEDRSQLNAVTAIRASGSPAHEIAAYAKAEDIDVIVMGTHGRGMMGHLLMGSVAEKVVRTAPCPVLTVHHPEHEFIQPDALQPVAAVTQRS